MMKGLLDFLIDYNNPLGQIFLDNFVILLIPMLNPDGVFKGNSRLDSEGTDLNRFYDHCPNNRFPSISAVMNLIDELNY